METDTHVLFYSHAPNKICAWMSNFWPCAFKDPYGRTYNNSEQYFMLQKALLFDPKNTNLINKILIETDPAKIKRYGRQVKNYDEDEWQKKVSKQCLRQIIINSLKILILLKN